MNIKDKENREQKSTKKLFYVLELFGLKRKLPILKSPSGINIAGFNIVGDMELLQRSGEFLSNKVKSNNVSYDIILTTELKGVPVAQEVARHLCCDYVCLRKSKKCYMLDPISINSGSITSGKSVYYLSSDDFEKLKNKNVLFVDDVFSTGTTFSNILNFANNSGFKISAGLSVLREGKKEADEDLIFNFKNTPVLCCGFLPIPEIKSNNYDNDLVADDNEFTI